MLNLFQHLAQMGFRVLLRLRSASERNEIFILLVQDPQRSRRGIFGNLNFYNNIFYDGIDFIIF
jgi:hypothetical protein